MGYWIKVVIESRAYLLCDQRCEGVLDLQWSPAGQFEDNVDKDCGQNVIHQHPNIVERLERSHIAARCPNDLIEGIPMRQLLAHVHHLLERRRFHIGRAAVVDLQVVAGKEGL